MNRLNKSYLKTITSSLKSENLSLPSQKVLSARPTIVHLGMGNFHRAHQCVFTEDAIDQANDHQESQWGIYGICFRTSDLKEKIMDQDYLYTVLDRQTNQARIMGIIKKIFFAPKQGQDILKIFQDDSIKIVTLTITEKGYSYLPSTQQLDLKKEEIISDLKNHHRKNIMPLTALGLIVKSLAIRQQAGLPPYTVLSCDNLTRNGLILRSLIIEFAREVDPLLSRWIEKQVAFPSCVIDRIVPNPQERDIDQIKKQYHYQDDGVLATEPFKQWIIEDHFPAGRPTWEKAGVLMTNDVLPFEQMKLRLLNGTHSTIAYLGYLAGFKTVKQAMEYLPLKNFIQQMMEESITPTLTIPQGTDLKTYRKTIIQRYENPHLEHQTHQIAADGSLKIPTRILEPLKTAYTNKTPYHHFEICLAVWILYLEGRRKLDHSTDDHSYQVHDPLAQDYSNLRRKHRLDQDFVLSILKIRSIFDPIFLKNHSFQQRIYRYYDLFKRHGVRTSLEKQLYRMV